MSTDPRIKRLRVDLGWPQSEMARFLNVTQPTIANMEGSQPESGPVGRLLDMLARALASGAARPGMDAVECLGALSGPSPASLEAALAETSGEAS